MYYVVLAIFIAGFVLIVRIVHSPFGQVLKAIRRTSRARSRSATTSIATSCWRSCCRPRCRAGRVATKTLVLGFATLTDVHWTMSGQVILMTLVGGMGTFFGPGASAPASSSRCRTYLADVSAHG